MYARPSAPERLEGQIAAKTKYLQQCEQFFEQAALELAKAPDDPFLKRRVRILAQMIMSTQLTIQSLQRMLRQLQ